MADNPPNTGEPTKPTKQTAKRLATLSRAASLPPGTPNIQHVVLERSSPIDTPDEALWGAIRNRTTAANFPYFEILVDLTFCQDSKDGQSNRLRECAGGAHSRRDALVANPEPAKCCYHGADAYNLLKAAAECFVALQCGVKVEPPIDLNMQSLIPDEADRGADFTTFQELQDKLTPYLTLNTLPYLQRIIDALKLLPAKSPLCDGLVQQPDCFPCMLELIWSYWHEEGMLVQSLNAICLRFQNKHNSRLRDPLANFRLDPLRPLNTLLWGYIQDEINRLTVARRAYE